MKQNKNKSKFFPKKNSKRKEDPKDREDMSILAKLQDTGSKVIFIFKSPKWEIVEKKEDKKTKRFLKKSYEETSRQVMPLSEHLAFHPNGKRRTPDVITEVLKDIMYDLGASSFEIH